MRGRPTKEFACYKGDEFIAIGTIKELAEKNRLCRNDFKVLHASSVEETQQGQPTCSICNRG